MKNLLMKNILLVLFVFSSSTAMAHSGHVTDGSAHGLFHPEHVIVLFAIGIVIFMIKRMSRK